VTWSQVKAITFAGGHLYYTNGDGKLYSVDFNGVTSIVGSNPPTVAGTAGYGGVTAMFVAGGYLFWQGGNRLYRQSMRNGVAIGGSTQISGPGKDTLVWNSTSLFFRTNSATQTAWPAPAAGWPATGVHNPPRWPVG
jgi:hypothetical protein